MLRSEAKQNDAALPYADLSERDLPSQLVFSKQPSTQQHILFRVASDNAHVRVCSRRKRRTINEVRRERVGQRRSDRILVIYVERHDRSRTIKLRRSNPLERVSQRQIELFDRQVTSVIKTNQHAAIVHELFEVLNTRLANAARVLSRHSSRSIPVDNLCGRLRCKNH